MTLCLCVFLGLDNHRRRTNTARLRARQQELLTRTPSPPLPTATGSPNPNPSSDKTASPLDCDLCYEPLAGGLPEHSLFGPECVHNRRIHTACALRHLHACVRYGRKLECPECFKPAPEALRFSELFSDPSCQPSSLHYFSVASLLLAGMAIMLSAPSTLARQVFTVMLTASSLATHGPFSMGMIYFSIMLHVMAVHPWAFACVFFRCTYLVVYITLLDLYIRLAVSIRERPVRQDQFLVRPACQGSRVHGMLRGHVGCGARIAVPILRPCGSLHRRLPPSAT